MMLVVTDPEGVRWADTATVLAQLGVSRKLLNKWVARGLIQEPIRTGELWWYRLDECLDVELSTLDSGRSSRAT